jgi:hypothetical protein
LRVWGWAAYFTAHQVLFAPKDAQHKQYAAVADAPYPHANLEFVVVARGGMVLHGGLNHK